VFFVFGFGSLGGFAVQRIFIMQFQATFWFVCGFKSFMSSDTQQQTGLTLGWRRRILIAQGSLFAS